MKSAGIVFIVSIFSLILFYSACDKVNDVGDTAYAFRGAITDAESGYPVAGVWVTMDLTLNADSFTVVSDSDGYYNFPFFYGAGHRDTTLYFGKDGYETFDMVVTIMFPDQAWDTVDVVLAPIDFVQPR